MTELLTESFCERCGTRHEFGTAEPLTRVQKTRGLMSGLRQFIMSQDSLADAIGDAMRGEEEALAARQLAAFQETFNFCLNCRRYICLSCWNDDAGRCRSCMPVAGVDDVEFDEPVTLPSPAELPPVPLLAGAEPAWPMEDGMAAAAEIELELGPVSEPEPVPEPEPLAAEAAPQPEPVEPEPTPQPVPEPEAEPIAAASPPPEPVEPEPPASPVIPRRDLRDTFVGPVRPTVVPREPAPETLAARRSQLDMLGIDDPGEGVVPDGARDQLPYRSSGASSVGGSAALAWMWAASSRPLEAGGRRAAVRPCASCALTVSATARFCRRCGAPQSLSA